MIGFPFMSFRVTATFVYHPSASEIYSELPFTANLEGLSTFHSSSSAVAKLNPSNSLPLSKKDLEIGKSFILAFKYCRDENHSSFFDFSSQAFRDRHILRIAGKSFGNSSSYVSGWLDSEDNFSFTNDCFFFLVHNTTHFLLCHNHLPHYLNLKTYIGAV